MSDIKWLPIADLGNAKRFVDRTAIANAAQRTYGLKAISPERGLVILYQPGKSSQCPQCHKSNWTIGNITAECGFCNYAIELEATNR